MVNLFELKLVEMHLREAKEGEKLSRFGKDIIMADRAYGTTKGEYRSCENYKSIITHTRRHGNQNVEMVK